MPKKKKKEYLFFDKRTIGWLNSFFLVPAKKIVRSKKFKRGY